MTIYCINIPTRRDRREKAEKEFKTHGLQVQYFNGVQAVKPPEIKIKHSYIWPTATNGVYGCLMSHLNIVKQAKVLNLDKIIVFEDDVVLCDDFNDRLKYILSLDLEYDIFYLGGHFYDEFDSRKQKTPTDIKHIEKVTACNGTYGYILNKSAYDIIIDNIDLAETIDNNYSYFIGSNRLKAYAFIPFLCKCFTSFSNVSQTNSTIKWGFYQQEKMIEI